MNGDYKERFTRINQLITGEGINEYARKTGSRTFGRKCKMPLSDLLAYTLSKQGLTTELKLQKYYQSRRRTEKRVSKQGYLQLRKRLNPEVFRYMNQECLCGFYGGAAPKTWAGPIDISNRLEQGGGVQLRRKSECIWAEQPSAQSFGV